MSNEQKQCKNDVTFINQMVKDGLMTIRQLAYWFKYFGDKYNDTSFLWEYVNNKCDPCNNCCDYCPNKSGHTYDSCIEYEMTNTNDQSLCLNIGIAQDTVYGLLQDKYDSKELLGLSESGLQDLFNLGFVYDDSHIIKELESNLNETAVKIIKDLLDKPSKSNFKLIALCLSLNNYPVTKEQKQFL